MILCGSGFDSAYHVLGSMEQRLGDGRSADPCFWFRPFSVDFGIFVKAGETFMNFLEVHIEPIKIELWRLQELCRALHCTVVMHVQNL